MYKPTALLSEATHVPQSTLSHHRSYGRQSQEVPEPWITCSSHWSAAVLFKVTVHVWDAVGNDYRGRVCRGTGSGPGDCVWAGKHIAEASQCISPKWKGYSLKGGTFWDIFKEQNQIKPLTEFEWDRNKYKYINIYIWLLDLFQVKSTLIGCQER